MIKYIFCFLMYIYSPAAFSDAIDLHLTDGSRIKVVTEDIIGMSLDKEGEYKLSENRYIFSGWPQKKFRSDFTISFDVKPMTSYKNDILGAYESDIAQWKLYFPSNGDVLRFITRNYSMNRTTMLDVRFSDFGILYEWNKIKIIRTGYQIELYINNVKAGEVTLKSDIPIVRADVNFGYVGSYSTDIYIKNISSY
ncbi:hypothetical protein [Agarilytica rhodophyticola]|uniref:hypothetical protein n=1 Tax=Agarilytica rhodophyticola TaxID=1737490 RepID=UPI000B344B13|nr:hypothetical protein [Agarilytica rhodophyticola]